MPRWYPFLEKTGKRVSDRALLSIGYRGLHVCREAISGVPYYTSRFMQKKIRMLQIGPRTILYPEADVDAYLVEDRAKRQVWWQRREPEREMTNDGWAQ